MLGASVERSSERSAGTVGSFSIAVAAALESERDAAAGLRENANLATGGEPSRLRLALAGINAPFRDRFGVTPLSDSDPAGGARPRPTRDTVPDSVRSRSAGVSRTSSALVGALQVSARLAVAGVSVSLSADVAPVIANDP